MLISRITLGAVLAALTGGLALKQVNSKNTSTCKREGVCGLCPAVWDCGLPPAAGEKERRREHFKGRVGAS